MEATWVKADHKLFEDVVWEFIIYTYATKKPSKPPDPVVAIGRLLLNFVLELMQLSWCWSNGGATIIYDARRRQAPERLQLDMGPASKWQDNKGSLSVADDLTP